MKATTHNHVPAKLLSTDKLTPLLREELKSRKLALILHDLGVEEQCPWLPTLNEPIADCLGIRTDAEFQKYNMLMERFANQTHTVGDISTFVAAITKELKKPYL